MRDLNLAWPEPVVIGDTNWARDQLSLLVNPGTGELDLWRTDYIGTQGMPMTEWSQWLSPSNTRPWALYVNPSEYQSSPL